MKNQRVRGATANVSVIDSTPILSDSAKVPYPGDESTLLDASSVTASVTGQTYVINSVVHALKGLDVGGSLPIILKQLSEPEVMALLRHLREWACSVRAVSRLHSMPAARCAVGLDAWVMSTRDIRRHLSGESTSPLPGVKPLVPGQFSALMAATVLKEKKAMLTGESMHAADCGSPRFVAMPGVPQGSIAATTRFPTVPASTGRPAVEPGRISAACAGGLHHGGGLAAVRRLQVRRRRHQAGAGEYLSPNRRSGAPTAHRYLCPLVSRSLG